MKPINLHNSNISTNSFVDSYGFIVFEGDDVIFLKDETWHKGKLYKIYSTNTNDKSMLLIQECNVDMIFYHYLTIDCVFLAKPYMLKFPEKFI